MQTEDPRHGSGAIIFVSLVAMIVIGIGTVAFAVMSATSSQGTRTSETTATDQALGLQFRLAVTPGTAPSGSSFQVNASVVNVLQRVNNVSGLDRYNGIGSNPVCKSAPIAFDVMQGYYTLSNYSSATVVNVHGPQNMMCVVGADDLSYYVFQPNSDNFTGAASTGSLHLTRTAQISVDVGQVWSQGFGSSGPLKAGEYTVVAADNWGQLAIVHFKVS